MAVLCGCVTIPSLPAVNLSEPGWQIYRGQAVWKPNRAAAELAGDILVARRNDRAFVQFAKTPFPILVADRSQDFWRIEFSLQRRIQSGRGEPDSRFVWLHLAQVLIGGFPPPEPWKHTINGSGQWRLVNPRSGETLEGYLTP